MDETLVVMGCEFGRMPVTEMVNTGGKTGGRDHNPKGFTYWMAGAGIKPGISYGATDEIGEAAVENPTISATSTPPSSTSWDSIINALPISTVGWRTN